MRQTTTVVKGIIMDETTTYTLQEISEVCHVSNEEVMEMIAHGLLQPKKRTAKEVHFDIQALHRLQTAVRLQHDLEINLAGVALALDLLDELKDLRQKLKILEQQNWK